MAKKSETKKSFGGLAGQKSSRTVEEKIAKLSDACIDLIYIDPPFNSNRNCEVFWGVTGRNAKEIG